MQQRSGVPYRVLVTINSFSIVMRRPPNAIHFVNTRNSKLLNSNAVFTRISAAALIKFFAPQIRRLFEGGRNKEICSFNLTVYFLSVRKS